MEEKEVKLNITIKFKVNDFAEQLHGITSLLLELTDSCDIELNGIALGKIIN